MPALVLPDSLFLADDHKLQLYCPIIVGATDKNQPSIVALFLLLLEALSNPLPLYHQWVEHLLSDGGLNIQAHLSLAAPDWPTVPMGYYYLNFMTFSPQNI